MVLVYVSMHHPHDTLTESHCESKVGFSNGEELFTCQKKNGEELLC